MALLGTRVKTDRQIQLDVLAEFAGDFRFRPTEIGVEVDVGVVTLTGTISSYLKLGQAAELAAGVYGVKDVANKLTVEGIGAHDDTKIAQAVRDTLIWDIDVPEERIDSIVRGGVVTLKGTVDRWAQRQAAHDAVARIRGVAHVNDHLVVAPSVRGDQEIFEDVRAALRRRLPMDDIDAVVDRGTVTLMGKVATYALRRDAERAAWGIDGVKDVVDKIVVTG